jgi:hypothetical protein
MMWFYLMSALTITTLQGPFWSQQQCDNALLKAIDDRPTYSTNNGDFKPEMVGVCFEGGGLHVLAERVKP